MKVGIGCITYNRPKHIQFWAKMISEYTDGDAVVHIANDSVERKGVAFRSNECLKDLYDSGCDYVFLFNDDCFPIKQGWTDFFIQASKASGQQHFIYQHETPGVKIIKSEHLDPKGEETFQGSTMQTTIDVYDNCNGCMMFMTREVLEKVGGFSNKFGIYGFEHANYSNRVYRAGLTPMGAYLCPEGASEFIYSLDIDNSRPEWRKELKHKSSMSAREALFHAGKGLEVYKKDEQLYYPL